MEVDVTRIGPWTVFFGGRRIAPQWDRMRVSGRNGVILDALGTTQVDAPAASPLLGVGPDVREGHLMGGGLRGEVPVVVIYELGVQEREDPGVNGVDE